jgi:hypothetical protein
MALPSPDTFHLELTNDRLSVIAEALLNVRYETERDMQSPLDDNYTRETAVLGRQRNMLIQLALGGKYDWLSMKDAGLGVTFGIGGIPCRFFTDDSQAPKKRGFFKRLVMDQLFAPSKAQPEMWRFVVEKAVTEDDADQVYLLGFNTDQEKVSEWRYRDQASVLRGVGGEPPAPVELPPATVGLKAKDELSADKKTGNQN